MQDVCFLFLRALGPYGKEVVMKKFAACLLVLGGISLLASGCFPKEEKTVDEAAVKKAAEHPAKAAEHPAKAAAPKDHPAH